MNPYDGDPNNFPAAIILPDDSDPPKAATFNPAPQGLADRTAYVQARLGKYHLVDIYQFGSALESVTTTPWSATAIGTANAWEDLTSATALLGGSPPIANVNDIIEVMFSTSCAIGGVTIGNIQRAALSFSDNGGAYAVMPTTARAIENVGSVAGPIGGPLVLTSTLAGFVGADGHTINFGVKGYADNTTTTIDLFASWQITVKLYRLNADNV